MTDPRIEILGWLLLCLTLIAGIWFARLMGWAVQVSDEMHEPVPPPKRPRLYVSCKMPDWLIEEIVDLHFAGKRKRQSH